MTKIFTSLITILLFALTSCKSTHWDYPYPEVPLRKPASQRASYKDGDFRRDAIEINPKYASIFAVIDTEVDAAVKNNPEKGDFGFIHQWHETKRRILYWKYGIDWLPVDEMTPGLMID